MANFYDSLKGLISQEMISKAATVVEEQPNKVSSAFASIIPSLLAVISKKGNTPQMRNIFEEAGNLNILSGMDSICEERPSQNQQRIGDNFLQHLLGDKAADFTDPIADKAGISKVAGNRLMSMIAPIVAGFFGNKLVKENWTLPRIIDQIDSEKDSYANLIPAGLAKSFGLNGVRAEQKGKKNNNWVIWVVLIIVLLLLLFWWKSCRNTDTANTMEEVTVTDTIRQLPESQRVANADRVSTEVSLPNGTRLQAYRGGVEEDMVNYLNSDEYKNASENDLKEKWFQFDNIAFEFNSATELKPESQAQLNNIVAILKNYKDAKIRVAGFADKRGTEQANMQISKERAKTIESMLDKAGVGSQVVRTEGFGDEYAKHSADAPDSERMEDRDIALRFVKQK